MDIINSVLVSFLRWHFGLFTSKTAHDRFVGIIEFLFDSALICQRTDNFFGLARLLNVLKLAHAISSSSAYLLFGKCPKTELDELMKNDSATLSTRLKAGTIAWIVSLLEHRCTRVRLMSWNVVCNYLDCSLLELFPSIVETSIANLSIVNEATAVLSLNYHFLYRCGRLLRQRQAIESDSYGVEQFVKVI